MIDLKRVVWQGPWSFDRNLVVLRPIGPGEEPENVDLNLSDFHVQVSGLPLLLIHTKMAEFVGNSIGKFLEFDGEQIKGGVLM